MNTEEQSPEQKLAQKQEREAAFRAQREAAPYAVVHVDASGIHPSTSRMVALTILTLTPLGDVHDTFYQVFDTETDIGPKHLHGLTPEDIEGKPSFSRSMRQVNGLLDGRTLIMHNMPRTWGFVYAESKLAVRNAQKKQRNRNRNRRGRRRTGRVARPTLLVDTLATARRIGLPLGDPRVRALARELGIEASAPQASEQRAQLPAEQVSVETAQLIGKIYFATKDDAATYDPHTLKGDRFGLQRSITRVEATDAICPFENPGTYQDGGKLIQGMEFVVSPDIEMDPDTVIAAGVDKGLSYAEKVTRQSSLVVCNETSILRGKAMHADRKQIPLIDDTTFMQLLDDVAPALATTRPTTQHKVSSRGQAKTGGKSQKAKPRGRRRATRPTEPRQAEAKRE
ncbi:hypothetical protein QVA66_04805 [Staphylococcus chromogenes]|nr:hypothetical protein [Staphylococcus chromogenes]